VQKVGSTTTTYYDVLGVGREATPEEVRNAYRRQASQLHPDRYAEASHAQRLEAANGMARVNAAWDVLGDLQRRRRYDGQLTTLLEWETAALGNVDGEGVYLPPVACEECDAVPTREATVWSVTSKWGIVPRISKQTGIYCHYCGTEIADEYQSHTLKKGWWGPLPMVATVIILIMNRVSRQKWDSLIPAPRGLDLLALPGSPHADTAEMLRRTEQKAETRQYVTG